MNYRETVMEATAFIHDNYDEEILVGDVSKHVFLSESYFSKLFRVFTGYSVKEYVNRYRLYMAAKKLKETNKRIIAIAFESGFSSQQTLTKKFVRQYGAPPAKFRNMNLGIDEFPPKNLFVERGISMELKKSFENVSFVTKKEFFVVGLETDIDYNRGTNNIGDLYDKWNGEKFEEMIPDQVHNKIVYGITHESEEDDTAKYTIGIEVSTLDNIPVGCIGRKFDTCEYAVFDTTLEIVESGEFWKHFYRVWLDEQGLQQPQAIETKNGNKFSRLANFEVYDENFEGLSSNIKIYAAILRG